MSYKITDTIIVDQNKNINSIGSANFTGPVIIGGGSSTGTVSQPLQVTGTNGAYIGGNLGIGSTNPSSKLWVGGDIYTTGIHTAQVLNASKDPGTGIATDFTNSLFGNGWRLSAPASTTYYKLATLPPGGSGNTFDHLIINGVLGAWTNGNQTPFEITFSNRGSFNYKYVSYGSVRSDVRIIGISTNSSIEIWAQHQASQFTKLVYNIPNSVESIVVSNPTSTTTAPTGTTVFDSSTVTPRFIIDESDNLGIGTISPTSKLWVNGDGYFTGVVTATAFKGDGSQLTGITAAGAISGLVVRDSSNNIVGTSGSVTQLTIGTGLSVTGTTGTAGIATITLSSNIVGTALSISGIATVGFITATNLYVSGVSTYANTLNVVPTSTNIAGLFSGTTSSDMVRITQLGSGNALVVEDSANPDATPFVIKSDGKVGINTITPSTELQLNGVLSFGSDNNIRIGDSSTGSSLAGALNNIFIGGSAGAGNTSAYGNIYLGSNVARYQTSGAYNVVIGDNAAILAPASGGSYSVILGTSAGFYNSGNYNTFLGNSSGSSNTSGTNNVFIGGSAGAGNTNNSGSVNIGMYAGQFTNGANNVIIGSYTNAPILSGNSQLVIGNIFNNWIVGNSSYNIGIGTTNPTSKLHVIGNGNFTGTITASSFSGNASSSTYATTAGIATYATTAGIATYATTAGIATYATTAGIATYATTAGVSTNTIGGISSVTQLSVSGLSTFSGIANYAASILGTQASFTGIVTASTFVGDGSLLTNLPWVTTSVGIHTLSNIGIGTTNPTTKLTIGGTTGISFTDTNVRIGDVSTGSSITSGTHNNFIGASAGKSTTFGSANNFFGRCAGRFNTTGGYNNFFGPFSGYNNTTGGYNNFFGSSAGYCNTTGGHNNFFGSNAGYYNTTGGCNNFFGRAAGRSNTTGTHNNFFGNIAGYNNATGSDNIFMGRYAGCTNTTGSQNVVIGYNQNTPVTIGNNQLVVGAGNTSWIVGNSSYNIGIGTTNPTSKLHVFGDGNFTGIITTSQIDLTANATTDDSVLYLSGSVLGTQSKNGIIGIGQLGFSDTNVIANFTHNVNSYGQIIVQNKNSGNQASSDIIVNNDRTGGTTYYGDFGINGTTFSGGGPFGDPDGTYLYSSGGTLSVGTNDALDFRVATGSASATPVTRLTVKGTSGNVGIGTTTPTEALQVQGNVSINGLVSYGSSFFTTATVSQTGIHSGLSTSIYRSVEYTIQANQGTNYHVTKILAIHDGTLAYNSEYGSIYNNGVVGTFDVDISGGNIRLLVTPASASTTNYSMNFIATKI